MTSWFARDRGEGYPSSADHLRDELLRAAGYVRAQLLRFRDACPEAQRERYWHLPDEHIGVIAGEAEHSPFEALNASPDVRDVLTWVAERRAAIDARKAATKADLRLVRLASEFRLSPRAVDVLLLALLPSLHSTYRRWYGILQHDPAKATGSAGFIAEMLAVDGAEYGAVLAAMSSDGALARSRLLVFGGSDDEPLPLRPVTVDDRVAAFLLPGDDPEDRGDRLDPRISSAAQLFDEAVDLGSLPLQPQVATRLEMLPNLRAADPEVFTRLRLQFFGPDHGLAVRAFRTVAVSVEARVLVVDVAAALSTGAPWPAIVEHSLRDARLGRAWPFFAGASGLFDTGETTARLDVLLAALARFPHPAALHVETSVSEDARTLPGWIPFRLPAPTIAMRERLWRSMLAAAPNEVRDRDAAARDLANAFQLTDSQIREAWQIAEGLARRRNVFMAPIGRDELYEACRQQSARRLVAFAQRIEPRPTLTLERDLVLPPANKQPLYELRARIRNHSRLHAEMRLGDHMRLGRGVTACFIGGSGTGKTMAAEVLASEHQIDLYRIDLSALVSKWVGDTPKNLERVFADAERANCMLFFDEADAIFGKRGEINDARDRWANLEVNYLLQRIEEYSGVVILATNLRQNIDDAFQRRIHVVVEFPTPDAKSRLQIWTRLLPSSCRTAIGDEDLRQLAQRFELTGGNIRNVVLDACFRALGQGNEAPSIRQLIAGIAREYQKISRPVTRGDFGPYYHWAMDDVVAPGPADGETVSVGA